MNTIKEFSQNIKKWYLPYLPHNPTFVSSSGKIQETTFNLSNGLTAYKNKSPFGSKQYHSISEHKIFRKEFLIVLRPLSDLYKDRNYEKILGWEKDSNGDIGSFLDLGDSHKTTINVLEYFSDLDKLLENHFDIFGLIEKGLAVDINTISVKNGG